MTLNDMVKRVKDRSHRGDVDVTSDDVTAQIIRAINDARREVIRMLPKHFLRKSTTVATVSGTSTYSLASDVQEPLLFRYTTGGADYFLQKVESEREFYQQLYGSQVANSKPRWFLDLGLDASGYRQIQVFPTPDAVYTITYVYMKDPTSTDLATADLATAFPDFPSYVQDIIWKGALYHFLKCFDDPKTVEAKLDYEEAKLALDNAEERDLDTDMSLRFPGNSRQFQDPQTGIRLI